MFGKVHPEYSLDLALVITPEAKGELRKIICISPPVVSPLPCSEAMGVSNPWQGVLSVIIRAVNMFNKQSQINCLKAKAVYKRSRRESCEPCRKYLDPKDQKYSSGFRENIKRSQSSSSSNQDVRPGILGTKYVAKNRPLVLIQHTVRKLPHARVSKTARHQTNRVLDRRCGAWRNQGRPWWKSHHVEHTGRPHIIPNHSPSSGNLTQVHRPKMVGWVAARVSRKRSLFGGALPPTRLELRTVLVRFFFFSYISTCRVRQGNVSLSYP
jgi:hypothetical protein